MNKKNALLKNKNCEAFMPRSKYILLAAKIIF